MAVASTGSAVSYPREDIHKYRYYEYNTTSTKKRTLSNIPALIMCSTHDRSNVEIQSILLELFFRDDDKVDAEERAFINLRAVNP